MSPSPAARQPQDLVIRRIWQVVKVSLTAAVAVAVISNWLMWRFESSALERRQSIRALDAAMLQVAWTTEAIRALLVPGEQPPTTTATPLQTTLAKTRVHLDEATRGISPAAQREARAWVAAGARLVDRSIACSDRCAALNGEQRATHEALIDQLGELRRQAHLRVGGLRLEQARMLRRLEAAPESVPLEQLVPAMRDSIGGQGWAADRLSRELHNLLQQMRTADHCADLSTLADLQRNEIDPTLERIAHLEARLGDPDRAAQLLPQRIAARFANQRQRIEEARHGRVLAADFDAWASEGQLMIHGLDSAAFQADTLQIEALSRRGQRLLIGGGLVFALALGITLMMARSGVHSARHQIGALATARDDAERSAQQSSAFLANMSHEIRTPMNGVLSMAQLLVETPMNSEQRQLTETIEQSAEALLGVLNDILDFSKLEAGMFSYEQRPLSLSRIVADVLHLFQESARSKRLDLTAEIDPLVADTHLGDGGRIRQILLNLVGNAVKFTASGHIVLEVHADNPPQDGRPQRLRIAVQDTGPGIDDALGERLFQPFTQGDASVTRRHGGTGLGLSISRQLAVGMGGDLSLASRSPEGCRFVLKLELDATTSAGAMPATAVPNDATVRARRKSTDLETAATLVEQRAAANPLAVLVAEDNAINRRVALRVLQRLGCEPTFAEDGALAVAIAAERRFDLILMDLQMPECSGFEACERIRRSPGPNRDTPTVALTASILSEDRGRCLEIGMQDVLTKPIRIADLRDVLDAWGERRVPPPPGL